MMQLVIGSLVGLEPVTFPDSSSYIHFSDVRNVGYPYFIHGLFSLGGDLRTVVIAQHLLLVPATIYLTFSVLKLTDSNWMAASVALLVLLNPFTIQFHNQILTESLFFSLSVIFLAALCQVSHNGDLRHAVVMGGALALAIAIKPIAYAFLPIIPMMLWINWPLLKSRPVKFLLYALMPVVAGLIAENLAHHYRHGQEARISLAPIHLFAKGSLVASNGENPFEADDPAYQLWQVVERDFAPVRDLIRSSPTLPAESYLSAKYEVFAQYQFARQEIAQAADSAGISSSEMMKKVGVERLLQNPLGYVRLVALNFYSVWTFYVASHPWSYAEINHYQEALMPLPFAEGAGFPEVIRPVKTAYIILPAIWSVAAAALGVIVFGIISLLRGKEMTSRFRVMLTASLLMHGYCLLVALTGIGIARYALSLWPFMVMTSLLLVLQLHHKKR
ncbi:hypothetical protein [Aestuariispira insulae]|nr:hypothetical protein [Aestuariispira insulae]